MTLKGRALPALPGGCSCRQLRFGRRACGAWSPLVLAQASDADAHRATAPCTGPSAAESPLCHVPCAARSPGRTEPPSRDGAPDGSRDPPPPRPTAGHLLGRGGRGSAAWPLIGRRGGVEESNAAADWPSPRGGCGPFKGAVGCGAAAEPALGGEPGAGAQAGGDSAGGRGASGSGA